MKFTFDNITLELIPTGKTFRAELKDRVADVEFIRTDRGKLEFLVDGEQITAHVSVDGAKQWVTINGQTEVLTKQSGARNSGGGGHHAAGELTAPMPGQVRAVNVSEGDTVTKGQTLLVLEAMKMEIRIQSPMDGTVGKLLVKQGQTVEREQILIEIS